MTPSIIYTVLTLSGLGVVAAAILYFISKKFSVQEDEWIGLVEEQLPASNCGGCGYPGCHAFAEAVVKANSLESLHCPVGGNPVMAQVAAVLGIEAVTKDPYVAVVRCNGTLSLRKKTSIYQGLHSCTLEHALYGGETDCYDGCLGLGECAAACKFDALHMDPATGLPMVLGDKCTACNACVTACPRDIIALWPKGRKNRQIYVACMNEEKGGTARKACSAACTGCAKCVDICKYDAVHVDNNLATIDPEKCKLCQKCVDVCDAGSIMAFNFPPKKVKDEPKETL
jgi:Na+-translocating ferredoxin:NAD+ oxidoreductase RNF subunit RnfB